RKWDKFERITGLEPGFIKRDEVACFITHLCKDTLNIPYQYAYIFKYGMDVAPTAAYIQLPENEGIKIFAITAADDPYAQIENLQPLYDDFSGRKALSLVLEKRTITEDMVPIATCTKFQSRDLNKLPYKPSLKDYADLHMPNGITARYFYSGTEKLKKGMPEQGMSVLAITDGMFELLPADSLKDVWFEQGEGRIVMGLQKAIRIDSLHIFAASNPQRSPVSFSLWASDKETMPSVSGDPKSQGWQYLTYVPQVNILGNTKYVFSVDLSSGKVSPYKWLMWVSNETGHGPYIFREVDVFEK
ncbi:MAG: hypothetical protein Q8867_07145, partial [Bacteroidota bacterium]|nr:hypothetical protein [Bacteroidota bacterium]